MDLKVRVRNVSKDAFLGDAIEIADSRASRKKGLLTRTGLEPGSGLWIVPCEAVHTFFMKFSIDLVYIDRKKRVRKTVAGLKPWRMSGCLPAHSVIELPVGVIEATGTAPGDQLEFGKPE